MKTQDELTAVVTANPHGPEANICRILYDAQSGMINEILERLHDHGQSNQENTTAHCAIVRSIAMEWGFLIDATTGDVTP